jgi:hypothetical protein
MKRLLITSAAVAASALALTATAFAGTKQPPFTWAGQSWHVFHSTGKLGQVWDPKMVSVDSNNVLHEKISGNTAGGIGSTTGWRTYGTWSADFQISQGAGKYVLLLAGHEGTPKNELDIAEGKKGDSARTTLMITRHWGVGKTNMSQHFVKNTDFTKWHNISVQWTKSAMIVSLDGDPVATYTTHVSTTPMHMTIQTAGANIGGAGADSELQVKNLTIGA